jgi:hypothetical protein
MGGSELSVSRRGTVRELCLVLGAQTFACRVVPTHTHPNHPPPGLNTLDRTRSSKQGEWGCPQTQIQLVFGFPV